MSRFDKNVSTRVPVLTSLSEEALHTTVDDLSNPDHSINLSSVSGKKRGMSLMIGDDIYLAEGREPDSVWTKVITLESDAPTWYPCFGDWGDTQVGGAILFNVPMTFKEKYFLYFSWFSAYKNLKEIPYCIFGDNTLGFGGAVW